MHLTHQLLVTGWTARGQQAQIVNPLLSQPVMEICLSLSARALTHGGDDRAMARQAFRDRLAPEVFARRSKGDLGRHYGRAIAEDLDAVRGLLLDGALVGAGLVDPERLDALLTPETLIWKGPYREVLDMVMLEQWARSWSGRLSRLGGAGVSECLVQPA
jgi:asparagine synthase (glutamine-hydrolysing)